MIINGYDLVYERPVSPMPDRKYRDHGVSWGLSEAGIDLRIKQSVVLHPFKRFKLASTVERFNMPLNMVAIIHDKSTWIRRGLMVGNSVAEPGWEGWLTLELFYFGNGILRIPAGAGIAQAIFHQITQKASYDGKYQNQANKPVEAING